MIRCPVGGGLGVVVELLQGGGGGQRGEPQPAGQAAGLGGVDLEAEQPFQGGGQRQAFGGGVVEDGREVLGGGVAASARRDGRAVAGRGWPGPSCSAAGLGGRVGRGVGHRRVFLPWAARGVAGEIDHDLGRGGGGQSGAWTLLRCAVGGCRSVRSAAAAARAAGPGGMRCLRRCGGAAVNAAIAARSRAATCPVSRTVAPAPAAARRWRAMTIPLLVAMSMLVRAEPVRDGHLGAGELGWDGVAVAAEGDQRLRR